MLYYFYLFVILFWFSVFSAFIDSFCFSAMSDLLSYIFNGNSILNRTVPEVKSFLDKSLPLRCAT